MAEQNPWSFLTLERLKVKPPISNNSVTKYDPGIVAQDAASTRIVVHAKFPQLVEEFLQHKRKYGSTYEKDLYGTAASFTWRDEVRRLIEKRPLVFMGGSDYTMLRDGTKLRGNARAEWDRNGTAQQHHNHHLTLQEYLSYDEIMLGSLIGVSGPSYFINDGNRNNRGIPGKKGSFEPRGIIIGLVGPRFEREDRMDSVHILRALERPRQHADLRQIFQNFFGAKRCSVKFDSAMYEARIRITIDTLLLEANARASDVGKTAYTYVVGLGLGVWQYVPNQGEYYIEAFARAVSELSLPNISTLEFAWIPVPQGIQKKMTEAAAEKGIKIIFSKRSPAAKLKTEELLVLSYAWDGNAFPGNEYWNGNVSASGDPAAACMSTIGELHNPLVNPFTERIKVLEE